MKAIKPLLQANDYKEYLINILNENAKTLKGQRIRLAQHLKCNPSYISQVLNEHQHLTPEQALATSQFLGHTEAEGRYFLNLVLLARSGTQELKMHYKNELEKLKADHLLVKNRIKANRQLSPSDQAQYYKVWYHAAIHMIVSLPAYRKKERIAEALKLPLRTVNQSVEFLMSVGLLKLKNAELQQGENNLLIGADSPFLIRHQTNWRVRALQELDDQKGDHLHYSGVITCSKSDLVAIREIMISAIQQIRATVKDSTDETLAVYNLDLFQILQG